MFSDSTGSHPVRRGDVLYIPIGASYTQECASEEIIGFHLTVSGAVSDRIEVRTCTDPDRICALFLRAHMLWSQKAPNYTYMCMAILYEILALSSAGLCADPPTPDDVLTPAMEYLQAHLYDADLSLQEACACSHISRTYFNRLFAARHHCTPLSWITSRRIERAGQLLLTGGYTNAEIAGLCGYRDVKYFYVRFRETTG
ncbi:MAG: helix-turn-helix transcriptional regulator, partial [Clostridia bacterium]|nr:helix-turn-helix transcriptional regulator [Clostridia bacterium]